MCRALSASEANELTEVILLAEWVGRCDCGGSKSREEVADADATRTRGCMLDGRNGEEDNGERVGVDATELRNGMRRKVEALRGRLSSLVDAVGEEGPALDPALPLLGVPSIGDTGSTFGEGISTVIVLDEATGDGGKGSDG